MRTCLGRGGTERAERSPGGRVDRTCLSSGCRERMDRGSAVTSNGLALATTGLLVMLFTETENRRRNMCIRPGAEGGAQSQAC